MSKVYADLDEIVFEGREKEYGAYQLRKRYNRYLERAALIAFVLFLLFTGGFKAKDWIFTEELPEEEFFDVTEVDLTAPPPSLDEEEAPPPPPKVEAPPPVKTTIEFRVPTPTPDDEVKEEQSIAEIDSVEKFDPGLKSQEGDPNADPFANMTTEEGPAEISAPTEQEVGPSEFVALEKEPAPVNLNDIKQLIGYPPMAKEAEIEGKVTVRIQVDKNGRYVKHIVLKDPHPILTKAVTDKLPQLQFTPGIQAGKPIKVWVTIPFDFKLMR